MRLLLILTALMLAIAAGVWWKTTRADAGDPEGALQTDPNWGVATFGAAPETPPAQPAVAAQPAAAKENLAVPAEAVLRNPHEKATQGDPKEPPLAANEIKPAAPALAAATDLRYTVKSGETLYRIVMRAYGTAPAELIAEVAKANGLKDPGALKAGQKLKLPSIAGWPAPKPL
jgi:nucleoid-associated protein YgaU